MLDGSGDFSGRILDYKTDEPIPYANILYAENRGVISNEEGKFSIHLKGPVDSLTISSLGYKTLYLKDFGQDMTLRLNPETTELPEVFLSNEHLSGREIVERVMEQFEENYGPEYAESNFFYRKSNNQDVGLDIEVKKSSIDEIDQALMNDIKENLPEEVGSYEEIAGVLYGNYEIQKMHIQKAAGLFNASANEKLEELADHLEQILRENIKKDSFLKIRTGIIGTKIEAEDLREGLKEEPVEEELHAEALAKRGKDRRERFHSWTQRDIQKLYSGMFWKEDNTLDFFHKHRRYEFELEGYSTLDDQVVYIIEVKPKGRADFRGKIYVNMTDYGVHRLEFHNVKDLSRFKLFGISSIDDLYSGKMIFTRNSGTYSPAYLELKVGTAVGVDRPLKIIERNRVVPGRNKQNQLKMNLDLNVRNVTTYQFYVFESSPMEKVYFENLEEFVDFEYQTFDKYNASYWEGTTIVEPNTAIKEYTSALP